MVIGLSSNRSEGGWAFAPPRRALRAIVFDMDGVLVDSEPIHREAANAVLGRDGHTLSEEDYLSYIGTTVETTWEDLQRRFGLPYQIEEYKRRYEEAIISRLRRPLRKQPGVDRLLALARANGARLALASSSLRTWVDATLEGLDLEDAFSIVVTGEETARGKPAPDIYLLAAARLGLASEECLAIEDSPAGVASARAARMYVVAVRTPYTDGLSLEGADLVLASLEDFPAALLSTAAPSGHGG